jgi:hypothetical protein
VTQQLFQPSLSNFSRICQNAVVYSNGGNGGGGDGGDGVCCGVGGGDDDNGYGGGGVTYCNEGLAIKEQ